MLTPGLLYTPGGTLLQRQAAFDRANQDLYAILYLATDQAAALLVAIHAYDERGTSGDGQKAMKELASKYLNVTNETTCALQAALSATTMEPDEDPDNYIMQEKRLRSRLAAVKEPITDRHFTDIIKHGLPKKYWNIKLTISKDPDFDLPNIQATMRHLYLDDLSRNKGKGVAGRGMAMLVEPAHETKQYHLPQLRQSRTLQEWLRRAWLTRHKEKSERGGIATSPLDGRLDQWPALDKKGVQCTRRPRTAMPTATRKELRAHRRVARTRRLSSAPKTATTTSMGGFLF